MENEKNYLEYLAELYPTIEKAATEIINLQSVINLPNCLLYTSPSPRD